MTTQTATAPESAPPEPTFADTAYDRTWSRIEAQHLREPWQAWFAAWRGTSQLEAALGLLHAIPEMSYTKEVPHFLLALMDTERAEKACRMAGHRHDDDRPCDFKLIRQKAKQVFIQTYLKPKEKRETARIVYAVKRDPELLPVLLQHLWSSGLWRDHVLHRDQEYDLVKQFLEQCSRSQRCSRDDVEFEMCDAVKNHLKLYFRVLARFQLAREVIFSNHLCNEAYEVFRDLALEPVKYSVTPKNLQEALLMGDTRSVALLALDMRMILNAGRKFDRREERRRDEERLERLAQNLVETKAKEGKVTAEIQEEIAGLEEEVKTLRRKLGK